MLQTRLLIVEDDAFLRDGLRELLISEGYQVDCAANCKEAYERMESDTYALVVLDVMLPDGSGLDLCAQWRREDQCMPILFLTACDEEIQIVRGLDMGGDDYVTKPFRLRELLSRIRALLRRNAPNKYTCGGLTVDLLNACVHVDGTPVYITPTELQLLSLLIRNPNRIMTREQLLGIWDPAGMFIDDNTLSVHISRLREKIGHDYIQTVRGIGYRFVEDTHT